MEITIQFLGALVIVLTIIAGVLQAYNYRKSMLAVACAAVLCVGLGFFVWLDKRKPEITTVPNAARPTAGTKDKQPSETPEPSVRSGFKSV